MRTPQHTAATDVSPSRPARKVSLRITTLLGLLAGAFLVGFVPMWWTAHSRANDLEIRTEQLADSELENALSSAAVLARQGEYEAAREAASRFFTELSREISVAPGDAEANGGTDALRASLTDRDEIITLLARSDPASADRLADLYMNFRAAGSARGQRTLR